MADPTLIVDAEPDWKESPEVSYSFATAIQGTPRFLEQRRPLLEYPIRGISCKFVLETENAQRCLNTLLSGVPQLCCVPIYPEPIFAGAIAQGSLSITAETDLTYLWNIQNCTYLILLDYITGASEMLKVSSVTGQVIALVAAIAGIWVAVQTVIYPAFAGAIKEVKKLDHSSKVASFGAQFEEVRAGEEATKVWVGLDEQICPQDTIVISACSEYFNGVDGSLLTSDIMYQRRGYPDPTIQGNRLHFVAIDEWGVDPSFKVNYYFPGTFDIVLTFEAANIEGQYQGGIYLEVYGTLHDYYINYSFTTTAVPGHSNHYLGVRWPDLTYQFAGADETSGKLRIMRNDNNEIYIFYWRDSGWEWNGSTSGLLVGIESGPMRPDITVYIDDASEVYLGDFVVVNGCSEVVWD